MVKRSVLAIVISACMMVGNSVFAADIDSMTLEELKAAYIELESEKVQLESENADLKDQIEQLKTTEEETEPSTEIVGTQYTDTATVQIVQKTRNECRSRGRTHEIKTGERTAAALLE